MDPNSSYFSRSVSSRRAAAGVFICGVTVFGLGLRTAYAFPYAKMREVKPVTEVKSKKSWIVAREQNSLVFGDHVRTGARGSAHIIFIRGGNSEIFLRANTEIQIQEPETPNRPLVLRLVGVVGEVFVRTKSRVEIRSAAAIAASNGTEYSVRLDSLTQTTLTVSEGQVIFSNDKIKAGIPVNPNEQSTARVGSAPTSPVRVDATGLLAWTNEVTGLPLPFELPSTPQDTLGLRNAKTLLDQGNAPGAEAAFRAELDSPQADEARAGVALSQLSRRDRVGAAATVEGATTPLSVGVRALLLLENNDAQGAQALLEPLAATAGASFQIHTLLALAQIQNADVAGAQRSAARAVELAPSSAGARATLGLAQFFSRTNDEAALQNARRALEIDSFSPLALLAVGRIEAARGNLDEARQALEQVALLSPNLPGAQRDLGVIELSLDRLPRAERALRASLALQPDDARTLASLGTVQLRRGDRAGARESLDRAAALAPDDPFVRASRAAFLVEEGELEAAAREGDFLLARQNAPQATVGTNAPLLTDDPTLGALYIRLSEAALFRQRLNEALRYARAAVKLLPDSSPAQYQLGRVFLEQGRTTQAQNRFQLATILDPNSARARYALGFAQELVAQGNDVSRPLGQTQGAREAASAGALSLQNQAAPGAFERFQAAIQDPTVVRSASRSFGDWQLDGRLGTNSTAEGEISYARESDDRRGLVAFGLRRDTTAGVRAAADSQESRVAISLGQKARNSPSALFAFASFERTNPIRDQDFDLPSPTFTDTFQRPLVLVGANIANGQNNRTRILMQADRASGDLGFPTGELDTDYKSIHAEVRHDRRLSTNWNLSAGLSTGQRRYDAFTSFSFGPTASFSSDSNVVAHNHVAYARLAFAPSTKLKLEGELKVRDFYNRVLVTSRSQPPVTPAPPPFRQITDGTELLPTFVATYQSSRSTLLRFRARRLLDTIEDFELLSPTDLFGFYAGNDVPALESGNAVLQKGALYELELSHTFSNASFLRVGLFRANQGRSTNLNTSEFFNYARVQGLRVGYEGLINTRTSFFTSASWNGSRVLPLNGDGIPYPPSTISGVPDYTGEAGLQYLSDSGFFVQPSVAYIGPRYRARQDGRDFRQQFGGFSLVNLRVGKRFGLRRTFYVEVSNLFDKTYTLAQQGSQRLQPGRQLRVGATFRF